MGDLPPRGSLGGWFVVAVFFSFEALVYSYDFGTHEPHTVGRGPSTGRVGSS